MSRQFRVTRLTGYTCQPPAVRSSHPDPCRAAPTSPEDFVTLPVLTRPVAAGHPLLVAPDSHHDTRLGFRRDFVKRFTRPVALRVGRKATTMKPTVEPGDVVLIDQDVTRRRRPAGGHIFTINEGPLTGRDGSGAW